MRVCLRLIDQSFLLSKVSLRMCMIHTFKMVPPRFLRPPDEKVSLFNKIWDDSGEGVPETNVFSSGKGLRPFLIGIFD